MIPYLLCNASLLCARASGFYPTGAPFNPEEIFTPVQYARIAGVANQCAYAGGPAVYTARALRALADGYMRAYNDECYTNGAPFTKQSAPETKIDPKEAFRLYPNPAKTYITVWADMQTNNTADLSVYSLTGQLVYQTTLHDGTQSLNIENWAEGLYLFHIKDAQGVVNTTRVSLVK